MPDMVPCSPHGLLYAVSADRLATLGQRSNDGRELWNALHANELHGAHGPAQ